MVSKDFDLKGFTKVEVGGAFEVEVIKAETFRVNVLADDFSHVRVEEISGTLIIKRQGIDWRAPFHVQPRAVVSLPALVGLDVSGASRVKLENFESDDSLTVTLSGASHVEAHNVVAGNLQVKVTGASHLTGEIKAKNDFTLDASGASKIELAGSGASTAMKVNGTSKVELSKFPVLSANVVISGASHVLIHLDGKLDARVSGASSLLWSGTPVMGDIQISGASNLHRR